MYPHTRARGPPRPCRAGLDDREITVLSGAHALGRAHKDRSGYEGTASSPDSSFLHHASWQSVDLLTRGDAFFHLAFECWGTWRNPYFPFSST